MPIKMKLKKMKEDACKMARCRICQKVQCSGEKLGQTGRGESKLPSATNLRRKKETMQRKYRRGRS
jgi:hypothetical protein